MIGCCVIVWHGSESVIRDMDGVEEKGRDFQIQHVFHRSRVRAPDNMRDSYRGYWLRRNRHDKEDFGSNKLMAITEYCVSWMQA